MKFDYVKELKNIKKDLSIMAIIVITINLIIVFLGLALLINGNLFLGLLQITISGFIAVYVFFDYKKETKRLCKKIKDFRLY